MLVLSYMASFTWFDDFSLTFFPLRMAPPLSAFFPHHNCIFITILVIAEKLRSLKWPSLWLKDFFLINKYSLCWAFSTWRANDYWLASSRHQGVLPQALPTSPQTCQMLTHVSGTLAGIGHKQGSKSGPFSVQVKMTDLCLIQGREKFVSYWKRQKSPGCFHFVILLQESGLCQYKSMSPAHSCHSELTLFMADMKPSHFQILSNAHLWTEAACGRKPVILLNHREGRETELS